MHEELGELAGIDGALKELPVVLYRFSGHPDHQVALLGQPVDQRLVVVAGTPKL